DACDGYPGIAGYGPKTAASLINRYGPIEEFPLDLLKDKRELALLFKDLALLRTDAQLFADVEELRWRGAKPEFRAVAQKLGDERLATRIAKLEKQLSQQNMAE